MNLKKILLVAGLGIMISNVSAQTSRRYTVAKPGTLVEMLSEEEANEITHLVLQGKLNAVDFRHLRDEFKKLQILDISNASISMYAGKNGTHPDRFYLSPTVGMPTLKDILQELEKPGRDPRGPIKVFEFDKNVRTIDDLRIGMELPGIVGNITNFGAFVDIGIKENGLIHLSQLAQKYVSNPNEIVSIHQQVRVKVLSVDTERKRIQLTMIGVSG